MCICGFALCHAYFPVLSTAHYTWHCPAATSSQEASVQCKLFSALQHTSVCMHKCFALPCSFQEASNRRLLTCPLTNTCSRTVWRLTTRQLFLKNIVVIMQSDTPPPIFTCTLRTGLARSHAQLIGSEPGYKDFKPFPKLVRKPSTHPYLEPVQPLITVSKVRIIWRSEESFGRQGRRGSWSICGARTTSKSNSTASKETTTSLVKSSTLWRSADTVERRSNVALK